MNVLLDTCALLALARAELPDAAAAALRAATEANVSAVSPWEVPRPPSSPTSTWSHSARAAL